MRYRFAVRCTAWAKHPPFPGLGLTDREVELVRPVEVVPAAEGGLDHRNEEGCVDRRSGELGDLFEVVSDDRKVKP